MQQPAQQPDKQSRKQAGDQSGDRPVPQRRPPRPGDASSLRKREEARERRHILTAYPRTRDLLGYLARSDREVFKEVLAHSRKITRRQANSALAMARKHHPELVRLIVRLRRSFPYAYNAAIRDLVSDAARVQRARGRGKAEYEVALTEWKLRSQARLVAARMTVANQPELTKQLEAILIQGEAAKRRQIELEIARHLRQVERLRRRLDQDPKRSVRSQLRKIQRQATSKRKRK